MCVYDLGRKWNFRQYKPRQDLLNLFHAALPQTHISFQQIELLIHDRVLQHHESFSTCSQHHHTYEQKLYLWPPWHTFVNAKHSSHCRRDGIVYSLPNGYGDILFRIITGKKGSGCPMWHIPTYKWSHELFTATELKKTVNTSTNYCVRNRKQV